MYYSPTILKMAGFESHASAIWFANIIAFSNALFTGVAMLLMDRAVRLGTGIAPRAHSPSSKA
jgi:hypothetical protein